MRYDLESFSEIEREKYKRRVRKVRRNRKRNDCERVSV